MKVHGRVGILINLWGHSIIINSCFSLIYLMPPSSKQFCWKAPPPLLCPPQQFQHTVVNYEWSLMKPTVPQPPHPPLAKKVPVRCTFRRRVNFGAQYLRDRRKTEKQYTFKTWSLTSVCTHIYTCKLLPWCRERWPVNMCSLFGQDTWWAANIQTGDQ